MAGDKFDAAVKTWRRSKPMSRWRTCSARPPPPSPARGHMTSASSTDATLTRQH